jgi:predicted enzyme related to lactoylglutathione lyase
MTEKSTTLAPGTFCWPELATTDQAAAETFYAKLFGWDVEKVPMGPDVHYTLFHSKGQSAGAATTLMPEQLKHGVPPHWNSYVSVKNADESAKKVKELGGQILMEPFDVMDKGRMFIAQDPAGAVFCTWQPLSHAGAGNLDETNGLVWTELTADAPEKAIPFYKELLGWASKTMDMGPEAGDYTVFSRGETPAAGAMKWPPHMKGAPAVWTPYFSVEDCDATVKKIEGLGGKLVMGPKDVPNTGRFAIVADPQGAVFAVIKMEPMPS